MFHHTQPHSSHTYTVGLLSYRLTLRHASQEVRPLDSADGSQTHSRCFVDLRTHQTPTTSRTCTGTRWQDFTPAATNNAVDEQLRCLLLVR